MEDEREWFSDSHDGTKRITGTIDTHKTSSIDSGNRWHSKMHAQELEAALRREEIAAMSSFNQGILSQLVQALNRRDAVPPPLD
ncbi:hypothetical protein F2P79_016369 [Pimephales promelas]|nr:hypothetical protein F2P79_016369 [Pimephales promelas]